MGLMHAKNIEPGDHIPALGLRVAIAEPATDFHTSIECVSTYGDGAVVKMTLPNDHPVTLQRGEDEAVAARSHAAGMGMDLFWIGVTEPTEDTRLVTDRHIIIVHRTTCQDEAVPGECRGGCPMGVW